MDEQQAISQDSASRADGGLGFGGMGWAAIAGDYSICMMAGSASARPGWKTAAPLFTIGSLRWNILFRGRNVLFSRSRELGRQPPGRMALPNRWGHPSR
jgi:hypothetical protein